MNKKYIIVALLTIFMFGLKVDAYVTPDELTSPEALVNYNYSPLTADHIQLVKAQNSNREYKSGKHVKKPWWRKLWEYIDPSTDDGYLLQKDIEAGNSWHQR